MTESAEEKLNKLLKSGKITTEEYEELKSLISEDEEGDKYNEIRSVEVELVSNDVEIIGWGENFVKISEGPDQLIIEKFGDRVKIGSKKRGFSLMDFGSYARNPVKVSILVPDSCSIKARTVTGDLKIKKVFANMELKTVNGDLVVEDVSGDVKLSTVSGDLRFKGCRGSISGEAKLGDIILDRCDAKFSLKTYSGNIFIEDSELSGGNITLYSGDFTLKSSVLKGDVTVESILGDINCQSVEGSFKLSAETKFGKIELSNLDSSYLVENKFVVYKNGRIMEKSKLPLGSRVIKEPGDFILTLKTKKGDIFLEI